MTSWLLLNKCQFLKLNLFQFFYIIKFLKKLVNSLKLKNGQLRLLSWKHYLLPIKHYHLPFKINLKKKLKMQKILWQNTGSNRTFTRFTQSSFTQHTITLEPCEYSRFASHRPIRGSIQLEVCDSKFSNQ